MAALHPLQLVVIQEAPRVRFTCLQKSVEVDFAKIVCVSELNGPVYLGVKLNPY